MGSQGGQEEWALRVRAAFIAALLRARGPRLLAAVFACRDKDFLLAELRGSRFRAPSVARARVLEILCGCLLDASSCAAFFRTDAEPFGAPNFTPARRALDNPIAMLVVANALHVCLPGCDGSLREQTLPPGWTEIYLHVRLRGRARGFLGPACNFSYSWLTQFQSEERALQIGDLQ